MKYTLHHGDCLEVIKEYPDNYFDTSITDDPYGLSKPPDIKEVLTHWLAGDDYEHRGGGFMGKSWDSFVPGPVVWKEVHRVLKPGGILLAFGGTRTFDLLSIALRLAGFEIRDTIFWVYSSGFPKSRNISKAIDEEAGAEREVIDSYSRKGRSAGIMGKETEIIRNITTPQTAAAKLWDGWGSSLKPAFEPIIVAMKPRDGTFANNALTHGVAGFNIDGARIPTDGEEITINTWDNGAQPFGDGAGKPFTGRTESRGRWPANFVHDGSDEVMGLFPQSNRSGYRPNSSVDHGAFFSNKGGVRGERGFDDKGSAARFFYTAKASRSERNAGLEGFESRNVPYEEFRPNMKTTKNYVSHYADGTPRSVNKPKNHHPTVKPIDLMRWLAVLTSTPTGGSVLDPFMGSGSTGIGCQLAGRSEFVGIDITPEYVEIARARMRHWSGEKALEEWRSGKPTPAEPNYSGLPLFEKE